MPVPLQTSSVLPVHFFCVLAVQTIASQVPALTSQIWLVVQAVVLTQPVPALLQVCRVLLEHLLSVFAEQMIASQVPAVELQY